MSYRLTTISFKLPTTSYRLKPIDFQLYRINKIPPGSVKNDQTNKKHT